MTTVASKFRLSTAVLAVAAVAVIPPVIAQADDTDTGSADSTASSSSVGSSASKTPKRQRGAAARNSASTGSSNSAATGSDSASGSNGGSGTSAAAADAGASTDIPDAALEVPTAGADATAAADAVGENPLLQNQLWWFGTPNPAPPPATDIYNFEPLANLPGYTRQMFGWMEDFEFEACVLGLGSVTQGQTVVGPYGTSTTSFSSSGCA